MKKFFLLLLFISALALDAQSTRTINQQLKLTQTPASETTNNIVSIDANGILKRTTQTVSQIGSIATLDEVLTSGNTSTNTINLTGTGDKFTISYDSSNTSILFNSTLLSGVDWRIQGLQIGSGLSATNSLMFTANNNEVLSLSTSGVTFNQTGIFNDNVSIANDSPNIRITDNQNSTNFLNLTIPETFTAARTQTFQDQDGEIPVHNQSTYTPTITNTGGGDYTATSLTGNYVRVGNLVTVRILVQGLTGTTGQFNISLPFQANFNAAANIYRITNSGFTDAQLGLLRIGTNLSNLILINVNSDTAISDATFTNSQIQLQVTYIVSP